MTDYFAVLGLKHSASEHEIKEAYRRLAKAHHPDSNPNNPSAAQRMKELNEAKAVLFDSTKRERHRAKLRLAELTPEAIEAWRQSAKMPYTGTTPPRPRPQQPEVRHPRFLGKWSAKARARFYIVVTILVIGIGGAFGYAYLFPPRPTHRDPVNRIILRHQKLTFVSAQVPDSIANDPERLHMTAELLYQNGAWNQAATYFFTALQHDPQAHALREHYSIALLQVGAFREAVETLTQWVPQDSNLARSFYNVGQLFERKGMTFDAADAYEETVLIGRRLNHRRQPYPDASRKAELRWQALD